MLLVFSGLEINSLSAFLLKNDTAKFKNHTAFYKRLDSVCLYKTLKCFCFFNLDKWFVMTFVKIYSLCR